MKVKYANACLILGCLLLTPKGSSGNERWSWGGGNGKQSTAEARSASSPSLRTSLQTDSKSRVPQTRSFGLFEGIGCALKIGKCKESEEEFFEGGQFYPGPPIYPGPIPIPVPVPVPYPAQGPYYGGPPPVYPETYKPIPIIESSYPEPPNNGYPPTYSKPVKEYVYKPKPTRTEIHHHTHTHVHENKPDIYESPNYRPIKGQVILPQKEIYGGGYSGSFAPTVVHGGSPHKGSGYDKHDEYDKYDKYPVKPIAVQPEVIVDTLYRPNPYYEDECNCVQSKYCSPYDIVQRIQGKDISYLINPRSEPIDILSNATETETYNARKPESYSDRSTTGSNNDRFVIRSRRETAVTNRLPHKASAPTAKGRAIDGRSPGLGACEYGFVCCRDSVKDSRLPQPECGKRFSSSIHGRVATAAYGKGVAEFGEYPWQAAILKTENYDSVFVCGATLISGQHVLTAAHCLTDQPIDYLKIRLGEWDVNSETEFYKHIDLPIKKVIVHPEYYAGNLENDIAVVALQSYVDFSHYPHIAPICLPNPYTEFSHQICYVTGWGKDAFGHHGNFQQILKEVEVPIVDRHECEYALQSTRLGRDYYLPKGFICAGGEEGEDTCEGDGGGPLVCSTGYNNFQLAGIVSWGIGCGLKGVPGVYVNIPLYVDWINTIIRY